MIITAEERSADPSLLPTFPTLLDEGSTLNNRIDNKQSCFYKQSMNQIQNFGSPGRFSACLNKFGAQTSPTFSRHSKRRVNLSTLPHTSKLCPHAPGNSAPHSGIFQTFHSKSPVIPQIPPKKISHSIIEHSSKQVQNPRGIVAGRQHFTLRQNLLEPNISPCP